jgi:hypothetical protein
VLFLIAQVETFGHGDALILSYLEKGKRDVLDVLLVRIEKMLYALIRSLRESVRA